MIALIAPQARVFEVICIPLGYFDISNTIDMML